MSTSWREFRTLEEVEVGERLLHMECWIELERDSNYGADADGNRGTEAVFIVDWGIDGVWDLESGEQVQLTPELMQEAWGEVWSRLRHLHAGTRSY